MPLAAAAAAVFRNSFLPPSGSALVRLSFVAAQALVWFVYREIYSTDGAPDVCRYGG